MIRHLLKLVWNRKRAHGLVILEIALSFLVVFGVAAAVAHFGAHWLMPLGFDRTDVWVVEIGMDRDPRDGLAADPVHIQTYASVMREIEALPGVISASGADAVPYDLSTTTHTREVEGRVVTFHSSTVGMGFLETLGIPLAAGRDFEPADEAQPWRAAIIDRELAQLWFGDADPVGRTPPFSQHEPGEAEIRVVGLIDEYRKDGELAAPTAFALLLRKDSAPGPDPYHKIALRLGGTAPTHFEESVLGRLRSVAPQWSFDLRSLESMRDRQMTAAFAAFAALGVIALFLLLMVGLGLVGVMWQNVTQRTREIGLRRACGASAGSIRRQVLIEMLLIAGIGVGVGAAIVVQLPVLGWFASLTGKTVMLGMVGSAAAMIFLTVACGLYPSHLATAVHPAHALHHD